MKPITFLGDSLEVIRAFPTDARREAGFQLDKVQHGLMPDDWKPMKTIGPGVNEIRIRDDDGVYRVVYIAKLEASVYVLHAFQKKTQKTAKIDLDLAKSRLQALLMRQS